MTTRTHVQRAAQSLKQAPALVRRGLRAADIWVQDHHVFLGISLLVGIATGVGLLLRFRLDLVLEPARQYAPVFTIVSITVGAVLGSITWLRKRRQARLTSKQPADS